MHVSYYSPTTEVRAVISVQHCHRGHKLGASLCLELKSQSLEHHYPTSVRRKSSGLNILLENTCSQFSGTTEALFTLVCKVKGMKVKFN